MGVWGGGQHPKNDHLHVRIFAQPFYGLLLIKTMNKMGKKVPRNLYKKIIMLQRFNLMKNKMKRKVSKLVSNLYSGRF